MATSNLDLPLIVIAGPTASGKTALAVKLAKRFGGEIICADSRTIYKYMDIGTAKPTTEERCDVPHWGLDLIEPGESYSAAQFKEYADRKITEIRKRGNIPFLVGGTGLYVDSVVFDFQFGKLGGGVLRSELEKRSLEELHEYCHEYNIKLPENEKNKRYVIREIERNGVDIKISKSPMNNTIVVGIATNMSVLRTRIEFRAEQIFYEGVVAEATKLGAKYGWNSEAMTGNIYPLVRDYLDGRMTRGELEAKFATSDYRLAKRQMTWLRRNPYVMWADLDSAEHYLTKRLANL